MSRRLRHGTRAAIRSDILQSLGRCGRCRGKLADPLWKTCADCRTHCRNVNRARRQKLKEGDGLPRYRCGFCGGLGHNARGCLKRRPGG